ncbi:MAG: hypothetical protein KDD33_01030 [Bdellovibrionales bacterium]|nr:hypothetical protein [Bdellovibrionales bacterium]
MRNGITLIFFFIFLGCSTNYFDELAKKDTPEAVFFQAKMEIDKGDYAAAIILLESLDPTFLANEERRSIYASAYSGRCGLEFFPLLNNVQNIGSATVFGTLMSSFPGAAITDSDDCIIAEGILSNIGAPSARNGDENMLMLFNSFAKMGTILSSLADTDDDGIADAGFSQCDNTDFPETWVRQIGSGLANMMLSLAEVGTGFVDDAGADITAICALDPNLARFCTNTDPASFNATEVWALRIAIGSSDIGINSCGSDFTTCAIANPIGACPP